MRFDRTTIALVPITMPNSIDMGFRALHAHRVPIAQGWLSVAGPVCAAIYLILSQFELTYLVGVAGFAFGTALFGAYLAAGIAAAAFGEPFTFESAWKRVFARGGQLFWMAIGLRLAELAASMLCLFPGIWVSVRYGFALEQKVLKDIGERRNDRAISELIGNATGDLIARALFITLFCLLAWISISATIDLGAELLLQFPIIRGRLEVDPRYFDDIEYLAGYVSNLLRKDPLAITFLTATALAVYPLGRLAWFFCLIDLRVRQDCWDIELQIEQDADRLCPAPAD